MRHAEVQALAQMSTSATIRIAPRPVLAAGRTFVLRRGRAAFTLVEVLAALLMMAIIIPVAMEGMSVASRAGVLGTRKAAAMRVAERLLNEVLIENQLQQTTGGGTLVDGDVSYPWTMRTENWSEDAMQVMTVTVSFVVQGNSYDVSLSTLLPATNPAGSDLAATQQ